MPSDTSPSPETAPEAPLPSAPISDTTPTGDSITVTATQPMAEGTPAAIKEAPVVFENASTPSVNGSVSSSIPPPPETLTAQTVGNEPLTPPVVVVRRNDVREFLTRALERISGKKKKKLERIMVEIERKGKISNDEVEKLLHCSDATATRYLAELEKQGRIKQAGRTGRWVIYTKT